MEEHQKRESPEASETTSGLNQSAVAGNLPCKFDSTDWNAAAIAALKKLHLNERFQLVALRPFFTEAEEKQVKADIKAWKEEKKALPEGKFPKRPLPRLQSAVTIEPGDDRTALRFLQAYNGKWNIYHTSNPVRSRAERRIAAKRREKKANREDMSGMSCLHLDIDPSSECTPEMILASLQAMDPPPTAIVFSGGGYQGFFKLKEPVPINGSIEAAEDAKLYNKQLEMDHGGADSTHDVCRIMRVPYTFNIPGWNKLAKGRTTTLATLVEHHPERVYDINTFKKAEPSDSDHSVTATERGHVELRALGLKPRVIDIITDWKKVSEAHPKKKDNSSSAWMMDALCQMCRAGLTDEVIFKVATDPAYSLHTLSRDDDHLRKQIKTARERTNVIQAGGKPDEKPTVLQLALCWLEEHSNSGAPLVYYNGEWLTYDKRTGIYSPREDAWIDGAVLAKYPAMRGNQLSEVQRLAKTRALVSSRTHTPPCMMETGEPTNHLLVVRNGIVDVRNGSMQPHSPDIFAVSAIPLDYDPLAPEPVNFMKVVREQLPEDCHELVHQLFGYALTGQHSHEVIPTFVGPPGTAKSLIATGLTTMLGRVNTCSPSLSQFGKQFGTEGTIGKLAIIIQETEMSSGANIDRSAILEFMLKTSSGNDQAVPRKNAKDWSGVLPGNLFLFGNKVPAFRDGNALNRRLCVITMTKQVPRRSKTCGWGRRSRRKVVPF